MMRKSLDWILNFLGIFWNFFPHFIRKFLLTSLMILESRHPNINDGLKNLLVLRDQLDWITNERAMKFGKKVHPKHRLTGYHTFFVERIGDGENVLDVGCGYGAVARSIAEEKSNSVVVGVDMDEGRLEQARLENKLGNLSFVFGDATKSIPKGDWDVVVLSNVLEHIVERSKFLNDIQNITGALKFLIRVPLFEREWQMALRKELGVNFYSDDDHKIEHTVAEFRAEIASSGLEIFELQTMWGEIWAVCGRVRKNVV